MIKHEKVWRNRIRAFFHTSRIVVASNLPKAFLAISVVALILRFSIRDRLPIISVVFYATPPAIIVTISLIAAIILLRRRRWLLAGSAFVLVLIGVLECVSSSFARHIPLDAPDGERIVFWNTCRGAAGWDRIAGTLHAFDGDIIGLVESGKVESEMHRFWSEKFTGYEVAGPVSGMTLLAKGHISATEYGPLDDGGRYGRFQVHLMQRTVHVVLVDFKSELFRSRRNAFERLIKIVDESLDRPLMVMGDFNTPLDSVFFEPLRARMEHTFLASGNGYDATWPVPFPVTSLDHIWVDSRLPLHSCSLPWTTWSDHRPVIVILTATAP